MARSWRILPAVSMALASAFTAMHAVAAEGTPRMRVSFDYGWRFKLGDPPDAVPLLTTAAQDPTFTGVQKCTAAAVVVVVDQW